MTNADEGPRPGEPTRGERLVALRCLEPALAAYGLSTHITDGTARPYLLTHVPGDHGERIFVDTRDGASHYVWGDGHAHPVDDPARAARRVTAELRHQPGERGSRCRSVADVAAPVRPRGTAYLSTDWDEQKPRGGR